MSFKTTAVREKGISEGNSYAQVNGSLDPWYAEPGTRSLVLQTQYKLILRLHCFPLMTYSHVKLWITEITKADLKMWQCRAFYTSTIGYITSGGNTGLIHC